MSLPLRLREIESRDLRPASRDADVIIAGAGLVGLTLACALAKGGLKVVVIDPVAPRQALDGGFDGRCSAIAFASVRMLQALGLWPALEAEAEAIREIRVSDRDSPFFLHFDHHDLGDAPLGQMVENRHLRAALYTAVAGEPRVDLRAPARIIDIARSRASVAVTLDDGTRVSAPLIVAADGRASALRAAARIRTLAWSYPQVGIVTTVAHERPHRGIAQERFLPAGPFAILPLNGNRSSLVWTERADIAGYVMELDARAFDEELAERFTDYLGTVRSVGPRWSYPLSLHQAERYVERRLALVGDAAHGIHPIAGQGLNLGLRDVAALAEVIVEDHRLGLDFGQATTLRRYERWRRVDAVVLAAVTDGLNRLFSNDIAPVALVRDLGLAMVNRLSPAKRLFMNHARGTLGRLPRLLTGEPL